MEQGTKAGDQQSVDKRAGDRERRPSVLVMMAKIRRESECKIRLHACFRVFMRERETNACMHVIRRSAAADSSSSREQLG